MVIVYGHSCAQRIDMFKLDDLLSLTPQNIKTELPEIEFKLLNDLIFKKREVGDEETSEK